MSHKWVQVADLLLRKTEEGILVWEETSSEDAYQTIVGKSAVVVERAGFGDEYIIVIRPGNGRVAEQFSTDDLHNYSHAPWAGKFSEMFLLIERRLSGKEQLLDDVLNDLSNRS